MTKATILIGDVRQRLAELPDQSVQCVVTSPPYWGLRDYGNEGQLGLESTPEAYVENMVAVFREVRRVLADDGVCWLNLGDSYFSKPKSNYDGKSLGLQSNGYKNKDLVGIPWRVAFALQADGWWLRQDIIWHKPNPMPESVTDRCTKAHEYLFMLTKSSRYYYDADPLRGEVTEASMKSGLNSDPETKKWGVSANNSRKDNDWSGERFKNYKGPNKRSVWTVNAKPFKGAHFAVMPEALCEPPILATSRLNDLVFDPFTGSGTVAVVALRHGRNFVGIELNPEYAKIAEARISGDQPIINEVKIETSSNK
jgi:DNA modification methylase